MDEIILEINVVDTDVENLQKKL